MSNSNYGVGIYSYPKSGNTLVRKIIGELFEINKKDFPRYIPDVHSAQKLAQGVLCNKDKHFFFYKSHTNYPIKTPATVADWDRLYIYIIRNPLDVFVSYINYISGNMGKRADIPILNIDSAIECGVFDVYFKSFLLFGQVQPHFFNKTSSWYENSKYWLNKSKCDGDVRFIYYEDLISGDFRSLFVALESLGFNEDEVSEVALKHISEPVDGKFVFNKESFKFVDYLSVSQIEEFVKFRREELYETGYLKKYELLLRS